MSHGYYALEYGGPPDEWEEQEYLLYPTFETVMDRVREKLTFALACRFDSPSRLPRIDLLLQEVVTNTVAEIDPRDHQDLLQQALVHMLAGEWETLADEAANRKWDLVSELPF